MSLDAKRLLGFAFAGADLLIEADAAGRVTLALGAARGLLGEGEDDLTGRFFSGLFTPLDRPVADALINSLESGLRRGPVVLRLAADPGKAAAINACRLAANGGAVSISLAKAACPPMPAGPFGLMEAASFETYAQSQILAAREAGEPLEMAMIQLQGLERICASMSAEEAEGVKAAIAGAVRLEARGGTAAALMGEDRFALLRQIGEGAGALADRVTRLARMAHPGAPAASAQTVTMQDQGAAEKVSRAIRFALEDFARDGLSSETPFNLSEAMSQSVQKTLARAGELGVIINEKRFNLAFQPVVGLLDGKAHHHEALVRFEAGESPFALIRLAEEFDLIEELDRLIVTEVVQRLKDDKSGKQRLAANVSGHTIGSEPFLENTLALMRSDDRLRGRLIFEITESAAIQDLPRADRHIQALRDAGSLVCLDDFGAGSASLSYLQELTLDIVKIDGRYVRELASNTRDGALVRHLVKMCRELKIRTVAEMVETAQIESMVRDAGVDFAQGWLYGLPSDIPQAPTLASKGAKRVGAVESWG